MKAPTIFLNTQNKSSNKITSYNYKSGREILNRNQQPNEQSHTNTNNVLMKQSFDF